MVCAGYWIVRAGAAWRMMPGDLPPWRSLKRALWEVVYQQTQRWLAAGRSRLRDTRRVRTQGVFESTVQDLRMLLRLAEGRAAQPSALTPEPYRPAPRAGNGRAITAPNAARAVRCAWP